VAIYRTRKKRFKAYHGLKEKQKEVRRAKKTNLPRGNRDLLGIGAVGSRGKMIGSWEETHFLATSKSGRGRIYNFLAPVRKRGYCGSYR